MINDEYNSQRAKEVTRADNFIMPGETERYKEFSSANENTLVEDGYNKNVTAKQAADRKKLLKILTGSLVTAGAASTFGVTTLINVGMSASFDQVNYQDGAIYFEFNAKNVKEDSKLFLHFSESDKEIESYDYSEEAYTSKDGVIKGSIALTKEMLDSFNTKLEEKNTDVTFQLTLTGEVGLDVVRTLDSYKVQFYHAESVFEKVKGECHCGEDGYYYFTLIYSDDYGIFEGFQAYIEDASGNKSECLDLDDSNAHEQHRISVVNMASSACKLVVTYYVKGEIQPRTVVTNIKL
ncbi:MAG: hypothetical protein K6E21_05750 [Bacilli bacterium]|nr:hypothetical protein [Bacilli bacterium]